MDKTTKAFVIAACCVVIGAGIAVPTYLWQKDQNEKVAQIKAEKEEAQLAAFEAELSRLRLQKLAEQQAKRKLAITVDRWRDLAIDSCTPQLQGKLLEAMRAKRPLSEDERDQFMDDCALKAWRKNLREVLPNKTPQQIDQLMRSHHNCQAFKYC